MNWKPILYEYVKMLNQRETDYGAVSDAGFVVDQRYEQLERQRQKRLKSWRLERGVEPTGSDTLLTIERVRESDREVKVDIAMRKEIHLRTNGAGYTEQRIDRERVTLAQTPQGNWTVTRIECIVPEMSPIGGPEAASVGGEVQRSVPYLNEKVLARPASAGWGRAYFYNREAAKAYADRHWNDPNPQFIHFDVDCTNYVSQCLYAGGAPMNYTGKRETGWWYSGKSGGRELWSFSWSVAHALHWYLMNGYAETVSSPRELTIGDVICYDFDGDGRFQHNTIVTGADDSGMPLVNAHTTNAKARYWDYQDSYAWTERTQYRFFHIRDTL